MSGYAQLSPERKRLVERARALWHQKPQLSTTKIAEQLGITKNALIGISHRNDFEPRFSVVDLNKARRTREIRIGMRSAPSTCQWISGEPGRDPPCGAPVEPGRPYCAEHAALAYRREPKKE